MGDRTSLGDTDSLGGTPPSAMPAADGAGGDASRVAIGDCLGRYTVRARLGAGGMGEVFEAHDPELHREVALKVLRPTVGGASAEARARFQREAQAMARLNHPNVVAVYDTGAIGERVFVAMELVRGPTLAAWIAAGPHPWRRVVDVFTDAGRGLAAAHAAGIVHRDFKPSNVILGDRTRVADFGLARAADAAAESAAAADVLVDQTVTQTGQALGTPKYMAPEQRAGEPVTALADQYAFCVALDEALAGVRAPRSLAALVARGRQADPAARFPSMAALLAELGRDRARTRRRAMAGGAVAVAGAAVAAALVLRPAGAPACADAGPRLAGIWDPARRDAVHAAFTAAKRAYAEDAWRDASASVDRYAKGWVDMANETCRATRVEGHQSDTLMDLRMACLDRHRAILGELTGLWAHGVDGPTMQHASSAARALPVLAECADAHALTERSPLPSDPAVVQRIAAARAQIDRVRALTLGHHWPEAKELSGPARAAADATGWAQVRAEAAYAAGDVLYDLDDPGAAAQLVEAARLAGEAHDDRLQAQSLVELVDQIAYLDRDGPRALAAADAASGVIARVSGDPRLAARLWSVRATALRVAGKLPEARQAIEEAERLVGPSSLERLELDGKLSLIETAQGQLVEARKLGEANLASAIALLGPSSPRVAQIAGNLGNSAVSAGDYPAAAAFFRQALTTLESAAGPDALPTSTARASLGNVELALGHVDAASELIERALAAQEAKLGPDHAAVGDTVGNLSNVRRKQGRFDEAIALATRAVAIEEKAHGDSNDLLTALVQLGSVYQVKNDLAGAAKQFRRAVEVGERALGPTSPDTISAVISVGEIDEERHDCAAAVPLLDRSIAVLDTPDLHDTPDLARAETVRARCDLAAGKAAAALPRLERALAVLDAAKQGPVEHGETRWVQALALWAAGRHAPALDAARAAAKELAGDADGAQDLAAVRAWLAAHGAG